MDMKKLMKYGMYLLLALLAPASFQSCNDDKDIVVITEELPLKVDHLYMVGDATPAGWNIGDPYEMTRDAENKYLFTYHGKLRTGEIKLPLSKGDWGATFVYAPAANTEINDKGVASDAIDIRKGGADNKWKVTKTGIYTFAVDLRTRKLTVTYEGEEPAGPILPIESEWLSFIGNATPYGWDIDGLKAKVQDGSAKFAVFDLTKHEIKVTKFVADAPAPAAPSPWDTENVYMIGSATPAGWSVDNGVSITKTGDHLFSIEVQLAEGEMKFMLNKDGFSGDKPYFFAPEENTVINESGVAKDGLFYGTESSYGDKKWKVTKAGKYKLTLDLKNKKFKAEYISA